MKAQKIGNLYDKLVWYLLFWCVFQDIALAAFLRVTGMVSLTKVLFFSKDILLITLFFWALIKSKLPRSYFGVCVIYCFIVFIQIFVTIINSDTINYTSLLSSIRGLILLPTLTVIGYCIYDKEKFLSTIKRYYWFLAIIAVIGIVEFFCDIFFGTKSFWMDFLKLEDYYVAIKGQSGGIENGTPGNWYTDIGKGYRTQKRLISIWAAPLTAGFVLLLPCMYYVINFLKNRKVINFKIQKAYLIDMFGAIICIIALVLTFTRQTLLPFLCVTVASFVYYNKKNRKIILVIGSILGISIIFLMKDKIIDYIFNGSTMVHIMRFKESFSQVNFWGSGIGSFGTRFAGSIATESQYVTVIGQTGVLTIIPYIYMLLYPIIYCRKKVRNVRDIAKPVICALCFSGLVFLAAGFVSETVAAFTSIAQYYVFIGFAWGYCKKYKETNDYGKEDKDSGDVSATIS